MAWPWGFAKSAAVPAARSDFSVAVVCRYRFPGWRREPQAREHRDPGPVPSRRSRAPVTGTAGSRGLNALLAIVSTPLSAPVIAVNQAASGRHQLRPRRRPVRYRRPCHHQGMRRERTCHRTCRLRVLRTRCGRRGPPGWRPVLDNRQDEPPLSLQRSRASPNRRGPRSTTRTRSGTKTNNAWSPKPKSMRGPSPGSRLGANPSTSAAG